VNYYKLEKVQEALEADYGATRISLGPKPRTEVWSRTVGDREHRIAISWEHEEEILSEEEVLAAADGLVIPRAHLLMKIKGRGGLWLGPTPPERKS